MKKICLCAVYLLMLGCLIGTAACTGNDGPIPLNTPERQAVIDETERLQEKTNGCSDDECPNDECPDGKGQDGECPDGKCPDGKCPEKDIRLRFPRIIIRDPHKRLPVQPTPIPVPNPAPRPQL